MFYTLVRLLLIVMLKPLFRYEVRGRRNIPKSGPVILAVNHVSYLDPVIVALAIGPRPINFMAKSELLKIPVFGSLLKGLNTFPVKRGLADKGAIAHSLKLLSNGEVLLIFPEGTRIRNNNGQLGKPYPGVTAIALKTGVPIVPIGLVGTDKVLPDGKRLPRFPKIEVRIGEVIQVEKISAKDRKEKEAELTNKVMGELERLIGEQV